VLLRDPVGRVHRVTLRSGNVVAVRLAGRFDPLLEQLYRRGVIDAAGVVAVLEALGRSDRRVGELAIDIAGVHPRDVEAALGAQLRTRLSELFRVAETSTTPSLLVRAVPTTEGGGALPWREVVRGTLRGRDLREAPARVPPSTAQTVSPRIATLPMPTSRAELRRLAKLCHPDLTRHLPAAEQAARAAQLARATAAFHGLR
jgi:hypothetical protein